MMIFIHIIFLIYLHQLLFQLLLVDKIWLNEEAGVWRAQLEKGTAAVPDYEEWGAEGHKVRADGRVWIKVK